MSTKEENGAKISNEAEGHGPVDGGRSDNGAGPVILFFILGLAVSLVIGWVVFPALLYSQKEQPVSFNHALHVQQVENGCESCHFFREDGSFSGVPTLAQCMECHEEAMSEDPEEIRFVEEYVMKGREVPWLVYARQPDCVFFSHAAHVAMARMDCVTCHGDIGESKSPRTYEYNRITGVSRDIWGANISGLKLHTWDRMKMDDCAECHKTNDKQRSSVQTKREACFVCHK